MGETTRTEKSFKVLGIHVAGAQTRKSAVVRGSFSLKTIRSGIDDVGSHALFASAMQQFFPKMAVGQESTEESSPFFWEALASEIGPSASHDSDTRLLETVASMGDADLICIDAPLSLPPCCVTSCHSCAGTNDCNQIQTKKMRQEWERDRELGEKRMRPPQPYLDRFFEYFARTHFRHPALSHCFEFDSVLGAGRSPLAARARFIAKRVQDMHPAALILETNAVATTLGQVLASGFQSSSPASMRSDLEQRTTRLTVFKRLEQRKLALRGAGLHEQAYMELASRLETFEAAMSALTARSLLTGSVFISQDFLELHPEKPLSGWACLPKEITDYVWKL